MDSSTHVTVSADALRYKPITIDIESLGISTPEHTPSQSIQLDLFNNTSVIAELDKIYRTNSGSVIWSGSVTDDPQGSVQLVARDGIVVGKIRYKYIDYIIRLSPEGQQYLMQVSQQNFSFAESTNIDSIPVQGQPVPPVPGTFNIPGDVIQADIDDGSVIDVIVAYTPEALAGAGGAAAIEATIELAVLETNTAYKNSNVTQRIDLVHMFKTNDSQNAKSSSVLLREFSYKQGDAINPADRTNYPTMDESRFDEIHTLRDTYHADFAQLIVEQDSSNSSLVGAGVAWLQATPNDATFEQSAFGLTRRDAATGNYTFAHELGHNMGLQHDWYVNDETAPYSYAHGFTNFQDNWRTIMAYNNRCDAAGTSCTRLLYFSNPGISYQGDPMGVSGNTPTNCVAGSTTPEPETCVANSTAVLNSQAASNAQFRVSQITWTGANSTDWNDAANWNIVQGPANHPGRTTTIANRIPLNIDDIVIPGGLTNYPTISSGTANAREVVIKDGATLTMTGGTLTIRGTQWKEEGSGQFNGTGGTVIFASSLNQTITSGSSSSFNNVTFGNGSTQDIDLSSNIDINGNLTINTGATLKAGGNTINLAGNWQENHSSGFLAETSTVIFDGTTQTVNKTTSSILLDEKFSKGNNGGCSCNSNKLPDGWIREQASGTGWLGGEITDDGEAIRWNNSPDAWLFTNAQTLEAGSTYQVSFKYQNSGNGNNSYSIHIGVSASSTAMTTDTEIVSVAGVTSTTEATATQTFTVPTTGTYYIGIRSQGNTHAIVDDFLLEANNDISFYNAQFASGETDFGANVKVNNNLQTDNGGTADFATNTVTVEGTVTNNGSIKQSKTVDNNTTTEFVRIKNAAGNTDKYFGVEITSTGNMSSTTVEVKGNQSCAAAVSSGVQRCYVITPTTNQLASIKYYYRTAEANSNTTPKLYLESGGSWTEQTTPPISGSGESVAATAAPMANYGTFALTESLTTTDTTPDAFTFTDQTDVATSTLITSNEITVAGINAAASISITGGEYSINGGAFTSTAGTVNVGDKVTVRHTSSTNNSESVDTVLTIGGVSDTFTSTTVAATDTTPDAFAFTDQTGVATSTLITSNEITVAGINAATAISITGGEYSINGGAFTSTAGTVNVGDKVTVRHTSSTNNSESVDTVLTIGGVSDTFTSTTVAATDTTPDAFAFTDQTDVATSTLITSNEITVAGINAATAISITGGEYSINGGAFTSTAGTVNVGDKVTVRHTSSTNNSESVDTVLTIGGVSDTFTSTTVAATDTTPGAFAFTDQTGVATSTLITSNEITVAGINAATAISITGGEYSINGGAFTSTAGTVNVGDKVTVRHTSSTNNSESVDTVLTIGGVSDTFTSTTVAATDTTPDAFAFTDQTGVATSTLITSNEITVAGINAAEAISITGGEYSINGGAFTSTAGTVNVGDKVTVRHTSSTNNSESVDTVLTIGGVSDTFTSTTVAATDTTPDAFAFTDQTGVATSTLITSNEITVAGINAAAAISITGGEYSINGGAFTSTAGTVNVGDKVTVRHTSSTNNSESVDTVLTIGGVSDTFTSTTQPPTPTPPAPTPPAPTSPAPTSPAPTPPAPAPSTSELQVNGGSEVTLSLEENQGIATQLITTGETGTVIYTIIGGLDANLFSVDSQGNLRFNTLPDFENPQDVDNNNSYEVIVQVSDNHNSFIQSLKIEVSDVAGLQDTTPQSVVFAPIPLNAAGLDQNGLTWLELPMTTHISHIENCLLDPEIMATDICKQAEFLYVALLGRTYDAPGLAYWINDAILAIQDGFNKHEAMAAITAHFLYSPEFKSILERESLTDDDGNIDHTALLNYLYREIGRERDDDGFNFWLDYLKQTNVQQMIAAFSYGAVSTEDGGEEDSAYVKARLILELEFLKFLEEQGVTPDDTLLRQVKQLLLEQREAVLSGTLTIDDLQ